MVTKKEILDAANIAKIAISDDDAKHFTKEINDVLKFVDMIHDVESECGSLALEKGVR